MTPRETLASGLNPVHHAAVLYAQLPRDVLDYEKLPGGHFSQDHLDVWRGVAVVVFKARVAERFYCHQVSMRGSGPSRPYFMVVRPCPQVGLARRKLAEADAAATIAMNHESHVYAP